MTGPASLQRRASRAVVFALVMTSTAVAAHALAGGMVPSAKTALLSAAALAAVGWALAARRRHAFTVVAASVAGQLGLHVAFALSMLAAGRSQSLALVLCGHLHGSTHVPLAAMAGMSDLPAQSPWSIGWMTLAHCAAAAGAVLAARHGEDLLTGLAAYVRARLRAVLAVRPLAAAPRRVRPAGVRRARSLVLLAAGTARRGPPLPCS